MNRFLSLMIRFSLGLAIGTVLVAGLFNLTLSAIPGWGSTAQELALSLPGDELTTSPTVLWTNAITIDAPPEQVWPWVAQIGDTRGGFYSYTFIENQVGALTGAADYKVIYTNANSIHPEWQDPQPGDAIIQGSLKIREVVPGSYLLAESIQPEPFLWVWGWYLEPGAGGDATRLISRFAIEVPDTAEENPIMGFMLNVGGFVMQQNMLQSLKLRAEGGSEPAWLETVEIALWLGALLAGIASGILYLTQKDWRAPLLAAVAAVVIIFGLTFVQPPVWLRFGLDASLAAGMVWAARQPQTSNEEARTF